MVLAGCVGVWGHQVDVHVCFVELGATLLVLLPEMCFVRSAAALGVYLSMRPVGKVILARCH